MLPPEVSSLVRVLAYPMAILSSNGVVDIANEGFAALSGRRGPLIGTDLRALVTDAPERVEDFLRQCSTTAEGHMGALGFRDREGNEVRWRCSGGLLRPAGADAPALLWLRVMPEANQSFVELNRRIEELNREIAARRAVEDDLRRSARQLRLITDTAPVFIAHCDTEQRFRFVNRAYAERFGVTPAECIGRHISEIVGQEAYAAFRPHAEAVLRGERVEFEVEVPYAALGPRYMHCSYAPEFDGAKRVAGFIAAISDVTARRQAERALRQSEEFAHLVMQSSHDCIKILDAEGTLLSMNENGQRLLEITDLAAFLHRSWIELWQNADREAARAAVAKAWAGGIGRFEGFCPTVTGKPKWWDVIITPIAGPDGEPQRLLSVSRDITDRKLNEEVLRRTERLAAAGRLAATISHEINNPLSAISNCLFLARSNPQDATKFLDMAEQELARVALITRQTLAFYRSSARPEVVPIPQLLDEVLQLYARTVTERGIRVERRYETTRAISLYAAEARQVFSNLIANALDAMPHGGRLVMRVRPALALDGRAPGGVTVVIGDTGSGISATQRRSLFQPFFTTKEKGTGLGLWVTQELVQKHGGSLRVRTCTRQGRSGTAFAVTFPPSPIPRELVTTNSGNAA